MFLVNDVIDRNKCKFLDLSDNLLKAYKAKAYNTCIASQAAYAAAAALFMFQTADIQLIGRRLSLRPQADLRPTNHTPRWSAV